MPEYHSPDQKKVQALKDIANKLRINSIKATNAAKSG
jgi:transketolase